MRRLAATVLACAPAAALNTLEQRQQCEFPPWDERVAQCDARWSAQYADAPNTTDGPQYGNVPSFHMSLGLPGSGDAAAGHSWFQRVNFLLQYDSPDDEAVAGSFGTGGAWLARAEANDPQDVCPCQHHFSCCAKNPKNPGSCGWLFESFEGGVGYGDDGSQSMPALFPKWKPGDSVGCYSAYTQSPIFHSNKYVPHACSWADAENDKVGFAAMGIVALSNHFLILPDGLTFQKDGLMGVAYVRTPFGKVNESDSRNFWTMVLDAENFAGPIGYFLPEFWGYREKGSVGTDVFKDFSNVPAISMSGPAWECQQMKMYTDGGVNKLPKMAFNLKNGRSVQWLGQQSHANSDIQDPLEKALGSRTGTLDPTTLLANGKNPSCKNGTGNAAFGPLHWGSFEHTTENGYCVSAAKPSTSGCAADGVCDIPQFYKDGQPVPASAASGALKKQAFPTVPRGKAGPYDALKNAPAGGCRDTPGPSDQTLYCSLLTDRTWVGYRWYRFVDQPGMQQALRTDTERDFVQGRVEALHKMAPGAINRWINGRDAEKEGRVTIDPSVVVAPPQGKESGHVPVVLYQGFEKPDGCVAPLPPGPAAPTPPPPPTPLEVV